MIKRVSPAFGNTLPLSLKVSLWGEKIGTLTWFEKAQTAQFQTNETYLLKPYNLTPTQPVKGTEPVQGIPGERYKGLPPFIADSLPDNWGSLVFHKWLQEKGIRNSNPLLALAYIGKRGMGALEYEPEFDQSNAGAPTLESLERLANKIYNQRTEAKLNLSEERDFHKFATLGTPPGGAHSKVLVSLNPDGTVGSGQIAGNEKQYILKFKEDYDVPAPEVEMAYHDAAVLAGIEMTHSSLIAINGQSHFLTERFDRKDGEKMHVATMSALIPRATDYTNLFYLCSTLGISQKRKEELFRRMCFNVVAGNTDDHNRNFAFVMDKNGKWDLSPAYDLTFTANVWKDSDADIHCTGISGKKCFFTGKDLIEFGEDFGIANAGTHLKKVCSATSSLTSLLKKYGVAEEWRTRICQTLDRIFPERQKLAVQSNRTKGMKI